MKKINGRESQPELTGEDQNIIEVQSSHQGLNRDYEVRADGYAPEQFATFFYDVPGGKMPQQELVKLKKGMKPEAAGKQQEIRFKGKRRSHIRGPRKIIFQNECHAKLREKRPQFVSQRHFR